MKYIDADALKIEINNHIKLMEDESTKYSKARVDEANETLSIIDTLIAEYKNMDLDKFTEKMNTWKTKYNHTSVKATMAFTARMFYMYPDIAREWYEGLPKATMD